MAFNIIVVADFGVHVLLVTVTFIVWALFGAIKCIYNAALVE